MHIHTLGYNHSSFLEEKRKDPIVGEQLKIGDRVVVCANDKLVFLEYVWNGCGKCPQCGGTETLNHLPLRNHIASTRRSRRRLKLNTSSPPTPRPAPRPTPTPRPAPLPRTNSTPHPSTNTRTSNSSSFEDNIFVGIGCIIVIGIVFFLFKQCSSDTTETEVATQNTPSATQNNVPVTNTQTSDSSCLYVITDRANIRSRISLNAPIIATADRNTRICPIDKQMPPNNSGLKAPWYKVNTQKGYGWISSEVLSQYSHPIVQSQCQNYNISNTYRVNAPGLNVRKNLEGLTNSNIIGELKGGYVCPISGQKYNMPGSRSKWLEIQLTNGQTGFISSRYLYKTHCHYVGAINLTVRSSPNNTGTQKAIVSLGDTVCAINEANGNRQDGRTSKWYQIINNDGQPMGWVNSAYLVSDRVNLTDNLPNENPLKELRRRIRQYNSSR